VSYRIRVATLEDRPALETLIARSARALGAPDYTPEQIEGALAGAFGVDTQLIHDGTYFVIEQGGAMAACGGWSRRPTLFGGDTRAQGRDGSMLDPRVDAAKIRAFFVDPDHARQGLGGMLLEHCEAAAIEQGFVNLELMATLPGERLYAKHGYRAGAPVDHSLTPDLVIRLVPMTKSTCTTIE